MSEGFVAFVRHADRILLMKRGNQVAHYPKLWDGIYGVGDPGDVDAVTARVAECTGLSADQLEPIRDGPARGIDMGNVLTDVTPWYFTASTDEVEPGSIYTEAEWVDPGEIEKYECAYQMEGSENTLDELYGDVAGYLFIVKTTINQEQKVAQEMMARLSGTGSLKHIQGEVFSILHPHQMRGYIFVESSARHHVESLIGRAGGRTTPLKNARTVLPGTAPLKDVTPYLEPKELTSGIEVGSIVEIVVGAFKNEKARVTSVSGTKEEVTMVLFEAAIPMELTMRGDHVRVIERVDG